MDKTTIHSNQFLIIQLEKSTKDLYVVTGIYSTYSSALHKAQEMAGMFHDSKYIVVAVAAVAQAVDNPVVVTTYTLKND
jgi:hypothetical protein